MQNHNGPVCLCFSYIIQASQSDIFSCEYNIYIILICLFNFRYNSLFLSYFITTWKLLTLQLLDYLHSVPQVLRKTVTGKRQLNTSKQNEPISLLCFAHECVLAGAVLMACTIWCVQANGWKSMCSGSRSAAILPLHLWEWWSGGSGGCRVSGKVGTPSPTHIHHSEPGVCI